MPGLEDLYREIILDHYRTPRNRGELPTPPAVVAQGHNPLCGDEITVYLQLDGDIVTDVKVGGQGCSISQSSASMMSQAIKGRSVDEVRALVQRFKGMMSIEDADGDGDGDGAGGRRRARRPRGAAGRRQVPGAHQVRHAGLEHAARGARPAAAGLTAHPWSPPDATEARARAGRAIRDIGHALVGHEADAELIDEVAATLDGLTKRLAEGAVRRRVREPARAERWLEPVADGERMVSYDERPFSGRSSPWGVDLEVHRHGDEIEAVAHAARRPRGRAGPLARRHRRRAVRRRVRVRARRRPGGRPSPAS